MRRSIISHAMEEKRSNQVRSGFWDAWFKCLEPLPGDEDLGKQPSPIECFSTMSRKQFVGMAIIALVIGLIGAGWVIGFSALGH